MALPFLLRVWCRDGGETKGWHADPPPIGAAHKFDDLHRFALFHQPGQPSHGGRAPEAQRGREFADAERLGIVRLAIHVVECRQPIVAGYWHGKIVAWPVVSPVI